MGLYQRWAMRKYVKILQGEAELGGWVELNQQVATQMYRREADISVLHCTHLHLKVSAPPSPPLQLWSAQVGHYCQTLRKARSGLDMVICYDGRISQPPAWCLLVHWLDADVSQGVTLNPWQVLLAGEAAINCLIKKKSINTCSSSSDEITTQCPPAGSRTVDEQRHSPPPPPSLPVLTSTLDVSWTPQPSVHATYLDNSILCSYWSTLTGLLLAAITPGKRGLWSLASYALYGCLGRQWGDADPPSPPPPPLVFS